MSLRIDKVGFILSILERRKQNIRLKSLTFKHMVDRDPDFKLSAFGSSHCGAADYGSGFVSAATRVTVEARV